MPEPCLASVLSQRESAELFRLMVAGIRECGVMMLDPKGTITIWNQAAQEMTGYASEQAIGARYALLYTDHDREQQVPGHDFELAARTGFAGNESWRRRSDGSTFWAHASLTALRDAGGALLGYSATLVDMTHFTNEISHMMGRKTIAEYVSDPAILGTLHAIGVDYAQGFWVSKPRPLLA